MYKHADRKDRSQTLEGKISVAVKVVTRPSEIVVYTLSNQTNQTS